MLEGCNPFHLYLRVSPIDYNRIYVWVDRNRIGLQVFAGAGNGSVAITRIVLLPATWWGWEDLPMPTPASVSVGVHGASEELPVHPKIFKKDCYPLLVLQPQFFLSFWTHGEHCRGVHGASWPPQMLGWAVVSLPSPFMLWEQWCDPANHIAAIPCPRPLREKMQGFLACSVATPQFENPCPQEYMLMLELLLPVATF